MYLILKVIESTHKKYPVSFVKEFNMSNYSKSRPNFYYSGLKLYFEEQKGDDAEIEFKKAL